VVCELPCRQREQSLSMGMPGTKASSPELLATWRGLTAQGSMGQEAREGRWVEVVRRSDKERSFIGRLHHNLPPLPRFCCSGAGLQLPARLTAYKTA